MDLSAERRALGSSYGHLQEAHQRLEAELGLLQKENAQALEQHTQVRDPQALPAAPPLTPLLPAPTTWENHAASD